MMMEKMKNVLRGLFLVLVTAMTVMACDPVIVNSQNELEHLLNSEKGQQMTPDELADMDRSSGDKLRGAGVEIHLPITDADTRPVEGAVYMCEDSTKLVFSYGEAPDTLRTIGTVDVEWHQNHWGESKGEGDQRLNSYYVQSRGKGIYTLWSMKAQNENGDVIVNEEGDTLKAPYFEGLLLYVYPGANKLIITRGCKETEHTYHKQS